MLVTIRNTLNKELSSKWYFVVGASDSSSYINNMLTANKMEEIKNLIAEEFTVEEVRLEFDFLTFYIKPNATLKESFERLVQKMKVSKIMPLLRRRGEATVITLILKPPEKNFKTRTSLILLLATLVTVFISGYFNSQSWTVVFRGNTFVEAAYFTVALMAIVGLHEIGHKVAAKVRKIESTLPYFIPGPPYPIGFGTFGAVIMQKEPPVNRDQLFDLGFSGPVTSFILASIVAALAILSSRSASPELLESLGVSVMNIPVNLAWIFIASLLKHPSDGLMLLPPIGWAAWLGFIITYLNLLPIWQLDGGHIANALFGERGHRIASMLGLAVTFITGFWFFGILILFLSVGRRKGLILDDVSPISSGRKILGAVAYIILILCAVFIWSL